MNESSECESDRTCMLLLLPAYGGSDNSQQLFIRCPRTQQISQRHLGVPKQTHLRDEEETRAWELEALQPPRLAKMFLCTSQSS